MTNKIKENWNKADTKCPTCGNVTRKVTGMNKQNLKKLCWSKPTLQDIIIFIMLIGILILALSYNSEIIHYKKMVSNPEGFCIKYYNEIIYKNLVFSDINQIYSEFNNSIQNG